ncbi:sortilin-related receptor-like isoform X1 [Onthophagus taurus]|uniref:sortilin-related receptor-like isoform X1 n=1 Tax=Onthophagus taurus TaxID=166361 RepID=UPI0039BECA3C
MVFRLLLCVSLFLANFLASGQVVIEESEHPRFILPENWNDPDDSLFRSAVSHIGDELRKKRDVTTPRSPTNNNIITNSSITVHHLNDTHKQLMVHWVGEGSNVIICLARNPILSSMSQSANPSTVFISYDYGDTFVNKTDLFKLNNLPNGNYSNVEKFYNHPNYKTHFVFSDTKNKYIFVTTNYGKTITPIKLEFTPSEVQFREMHSNDILILDKTSPDRTLWYSSNFGRTFDILEQHVKSFTWTNNKNYLILQRTLPSNLSSIMYTKMSPLSRQHLQLFAKDVVDMFVKDDYVFYVKKSTSDDFDLFVSYNFDSPRQCIFDTELKRKSYQVVDVTNDRVFVSISHTEMISHLYVSDNLNVEKNSQTNVKLTLSLENVLAYFHNSWPDSWLQFFFRHIAEEAFTDIYKVEGMTGIYIASQIAYTPRNQYNLGPENLVTKITFDHGASWRLIRSPEHDNEGQIISCDQGNNCSLHLTQRFNQLYPDTRTLSILSSKSAPGILVATGVIGKSLKGHFGVYISTDAGLTWRQSLKDLHFFNMGDHGGLLTAVKYYKTRHDTNSLLYSTDMGEKWEEKEFDKESIRLYGLMTEPGANTTVFTLFGSKVEQHQWIIVKIDLKNVFKYNCTDLDYKTWSPSVSVDGRRLIPCPLGKQQTYKRRIPHAECYIGTNYDMPISEEPCACTATDYECDFGFMQDESHGHCIRNKSSKFDPYEIPEMCQPGQMYNRTKGYRKISGDVCSKGYYDFYAPDVIPCPFKEIPTFLLIAQRDRIIRLNPVTRQKEDLPVADFRNVIAIDFDMKNNCVFWADIIKDHIGRQCLDGKSPNEILINSNLSSVEGMSYDWISKNLYFVDGRDAKIELIRVDVPQPRHYRRTILTPPILKKPRGIIVHPIAEFLFWTDWASHPSISKANLNGTNVTQLFKSPVIEWPNGITIDYIAERIYWVDAKLDYIGSSDFYGNKFNKVLHDSIYVMHPFSVAVFKDTMYWDDWKRNSIFSADKDHGIGIDTLANEIHGLMEMKIYAHSIQDGTNACANSTCQYICVSVNQKPVCLCPDGFDMKDGKCVCPGGSVPNANMSCPKYQSTCSFKYFACKSGQCIPKSWQCDNENDCAEGEDEKNCESATCAPNYFACDNGLCLPTYWRCDFDKDCPDGADERNCPVQNCTQSQFKCNNGRCISNHWKCDGENDCRDNSDELNCFDSVPAVCKTDEFKCTTGGISCIPLSWYCDGENDCSDHSDEAQCNNLTCSEYQFKCGGPNEKCIVKQWVCDGDKDCPDGSDEKNCTESTSTVEPTPVSTYNCHEWMFKCDSQLCIPYWWKCDMAIDCDDGSDEAGCYYPTTTATNLNVTASEIPWSSSTCAANQFQCVSGYCISSSWVCDGMADCEDREDELHCPIAPKCSLDQYTCRFDGSCISLSKVCDGNIDCLNGQDEESCTYNHNVPEIPAPPTCSIGFFPCDVNICHPMAQRCDGFQHCADGFDENNCTNVDRYYQVLQMGIEDRGRTESSLFLYWWIAMPENEKLEFLPSISMIGNNTWQNGTWIDTSNYTFKNLEPFTHYNMTVYVRVANTTRVFPPAKFYPSMTTEGVPSIPLNVTVNQVNASHVLVSWNQPTHVHGVIKAYEVGFYPPSPPIHITQHNNSTSMMLDPDFETGVKYSFYVIAHNAKHSSGLSEVVTIVFDKDAEVEAVENLRVTAQDEHNISLAWDYEKRYDEFLVEITVRSPYPKLQPRRTNTTKIDIKNLSPSVLYQFEVRSVHKQFKGPYSYIATYTNGTSLPEVPNLSVMINKNEATSVKVSWDRPKYAKKANWMYGVYYGLTVDEVLEKPRFNTSSLGATITGLGACESYIFTVGLIGPLGVGPLQTDSHIVKTFFNVRAPPENLRVTQGSRRYDMMTVKWSASCPTINQDLGYIISVTELGRNEMMPFKLKNVTATEISHDFYVNFGGIYKVVVSTDAEGAKPSPEVIYNAPPVPPAFDVQVMIENNGSYVVYWRGHNITALNLANVSYEYEVLISEGKDLNEKTAQRFTVTNPPFIYNNVTAEMYSFGVMMKTERGYRSALSNVATVKTPEASPWMGDISKTSLTTVLVIVCLLLVVSGGALGFLYVRHKRLQNSFTRFANSHYDSRSDAATFDDHGLEEEESPQIRGFSDDEPLVIA